VLDSKTVVLDENANELFNIHDYCINTLACDTHSFMLLKGAPIQYADHMFPIGSMFFKSNAYIYKNFSVILEQFEKVRQYNLFSNKKAPQCGAFLLVILNFLERTRDLRP
jgi:hypothetical protein